MARTRSTLNVVSAALALFIMAFLVWDASSAAFTASTTEADTVTAVEINLDSVSVVDFGGVVLGPTQSEQSCVEVTFSDTSGTWDPTLLSVQVESSLTSGVAALTDHLGMVIDVVDNCTDQNVETSAFYNGSLAGTGNSLWAPASSGDMRGFLITVTLDGAVQDAAQGESAGFSITWSVATN